MADEKSMTVRAAASKLLVEEHADVLREAVRVMLREVMEAEVSRLAGRTGMSARRSGRRSGMGIAGGSGTRGWGRSSWRSRGCGRARTASAPRIGA